MNREPGNLDKKDGKSKVLKLFGATRKKTQKQEISKPLQLAVPLDEDLKTEQQEERTVERDQGEELTDMTSECATVPCKQRFGQLQTPGEEISVVTNMSSEGASTSHQQTTVTLQMKSDMALDRIKYDAQILFKAPDKKRFQRIKDELSELKAISSLQFDLVHDSTTCTVKTYIFKSCLLLKDFYKCVVQFAIYPHLISVITANMVDVTVEMFSENTNLPLYENEAPDLRDTSIFFKAPSQEGMNAIMDELEPLRPFSALKFDIESSNSSNSITMVIQRNTFSAEDFFTSVLQFPTYVHLMKAIVENLVEVKMQISSAGNSSGVVYEFISDQSSCISEDECYMEPTISSDNKKTSLKTKIRKKCTGLTKAFSNVQHAMRNRKQPDPAACPPATKTC